MIPDAVALFDETEGARDPFFGVMECGYGLPSPSSYIQVDVTQNLNSVGIKFFFFKKYFY